LKFLNLPLDAKVLIYTISSEFVTQFTVNSPVMFWDGINYSKKPVSSGIYYYIIKWDDGREIRKGKIFVLRSKK